MPLKTTHSFRRGGYHIIKVIFMLLAFTIAAAPAFAQDHVIQKPVRPEKKQEATTTTKPKTNTNTTTTDTLKPKANTDTNTTTTDTPKPKTNTDTSTTTTDTPKPKTNTNTNANKSSSSTSTNNQGSGNSTTTTTPVPKPTTGAINGHEWVDLGLSVKWATCNVGASSPSDYGNYYAWGETSTKSSYTEANSKTYGKSMGGIAGNSAYDAARANWGGTWRLPTAREIDELVARCKWTWVTICGHHGYKVTGPNGNSIFLPAAGLRRKTSHKHTGKLGDYWSATPREDNWDHAYGLDSRDDDFSKDWDYRDHGRSVRPVSE